MERANDLAGALPLLQAQILLEHADVYRVLGEATAARRLLRQAATLFREADWKRATTIDQLNLLECACLAARLEPTAASEWLVRYAALPKSDPGWLSLTRDRRTQALEAQARGIVECAVGERKRGLARLREALGIWESIGYRRRAAYAAADLAAAGETQAAQRIPMLLSAAPGHPLVHTAPRPRAAAPPATPRTDIALSGAEMRVLEALCAGISVREMAKQWDRSEFTIRNHLKRLFAKYKVRSSAALVAKALNLNAMPTEGRRKRTVPAAPA
ncbi:MAG: helix-turn-helix transcriptional regulator [Candidatus Eremiobacteraeota bacterium]|nr:helix-turn-helix transcriptional regulator [Candidatus Eremiobacteraeota bacterium]